MTDGSLRILVIKLRYLGDVLLTTPVFDALRSRFPSAFIAALVNKGTEDMLTDNPAINRIFTLERDASFLPDLQKQVRLIREIRNTKFDMVLDLTWNDHAAFLAWLSGAKKRFTYKTTDKTGKKNPSHRSLLFTNLIDAEKNLHILKKHLEMAKALGCAPLPSKPSLYWSPEDRKNLRSNIAKPRHIREYCRLSFCIPHPMRITRCGLWKVTPLYAITCGTSGRSGPF